MVNISGVLNYFPWVDFVPYDIDSWLYYWGRGIRTSQLRSKQPLIFQWDDVISLDSLYLYCATLIFMPWNVLIKVIFEKQTTGLDKCQVTWLHMYLGSLWLSRFHVLIDSTGCRGWHFQNNFSSPAYICRHVEWDSFKVTRTWETHVYVGEYICSPIIKVHAHDRRTWN